jgi:hypothetical protein
MAEDLVVSERQQDCDVGPVCEALKAGAPKAKEEGNFAQGGQQHG